MTLPSYHTAQQSTIADTSGGGDESAHFAVALRQLAAASARLSSPSAPAPPPQPRERQAAALIAQVVRALSLCSIQVRSRRVP
jgi:hypothetical protein